MRFPRVLTEMVAPTERTPPSRLPEEMDRPGCDPLLLRDALDTLARANRRFGTRALVASAVDDILTGRPPGPLRILDVGTGSGDVGTHVARRLAGEGFRVRAVLADLHAGVLALARDRLKEELPGRLHGHLAFVRLTAPALPFPDDSFDLAVSSTMLHHLEDGEAAGFLAELDRVSAAGWVVTDLRRSAPAYAALRLLAGTLWRRHPLPRRDGPVSVRRSFTAPEVRGLLEQAGVRSSRVERRFPFRLRICRGGAGA